MTRNLVVTMAIGETSRKYLEFTGPKIQAYAQKCGADYLVHQTEVPGYPSLGYQKCEYDKILSVYDRILHVDADMVVRSNTPNIFDLTATFAAVDELPYQNLSIEFPPVDRIKDVSLLGKLATKHHFNLGLYLFSREHKGMFTQVNEKGQYFKEQSDLNYALAYWGVQVTCLPPQFNFMKLMADAGLNKDDAYIIHYAGGYGGLDPESILKMMKEDYR